MNPTKVLGIDIPSTTSEAWYHTFTFAEKRVAIYIPNIENDPNIQGHKRTFAFAYDPPQASMHQQDGPLDATERIFGTTAENELA